MPNKVFLFWTIFAIATVSLYACGGPTLRRWILLI